MRHRPPGGFLEPVSQPVVSTQVRGIDNQNSPQPVPLRHDSRERERVYPCLLKQLIVEWVEKGFGRPTQTSQLSTFNHQPLRQAGLYESGPARVALTRRVVEPVCSPRKAWSLTIGNNALYGREFAAPRIRQNANPIEIVEGKNVRIQGSVRLSTGGQEEGRGGFVCRDDGLSRGSEGTVTNAFQSKLKTVS